VLNLMECVRELMMSMLVGVMNKNENGLVRRQDLGKYKDLKIGSNFVKARSQLGPCFTQIETFAPANGLSFVLAAKQPGACGEWLDYR
jgi:hypothetical protein